MEYEEIVGYLNDYKIDEKDRKRLKKKYKIPKILVDNEDFLNFVKHLVDFFDVYSNVICDSGIFCNVDKNQINITVGELSMLKEGHRDVINYILREINKIKKTGDRNE